MIDIQKLIKDAVDNGICEDGIVRMLNSSGADDLMKFYIEGLDFCLSNDFPDLDYLREHGQGITERYGVYVDGNISVSNSRFSVFLGKSVGRIEFTDYTVGEVYIKHTSSVELLLSGNSVVRVDCFDDTKVKLILNDNSKAFVNIYGRSECDYSTTGNAKVRLINKGRRTY